MVAFAAPGWISWKKNEKKVTQASNKKAALDPNLIDNGRGNQREQANS